ncbi:hypothetical protein BDP27DRAFT_1319139 [Rhodocollybia butyracea]|uniref:F-box domain-containing protein n=1 Tax=Rhodocollybia butyracea TaxID=206335 RepID=A0A9P5PVL1_9AGAR|nr:hypothetical protein BDP27DRAFT_1319139 [Rhodocollybia butyracea]
MHQALLIDEILATVLDSCTDSASLSRIGRVCQAWDPAFDRLWATYLPSFDPLLELIPGVLTVDGVYVLESPVSPDFRRLRHYASRVKNIAYRQHIKIHPTLLSFLLQDCKVAFIFQKLATVRLALTNCLSICPVISMTTRLKKIDLDLVNRTALDFILTVDRVSTCFTSLDLRGMASSELVNAVSGLSRLEYLSLRIGASLPAETVLALATFPCLKELELQTSHLLPEDLCFSSTCFPSLQSLNIRGRTSFIEKLLQNMQSEHLSVLTIDIELMSSTDDTWTGLFTAIRDKTRASLHELTIEHHMDTEDLSLDDDDTTSSDTTPTTHTNNNPIRTNPNALLQFDHLQSLSNHYFLRRLTIETTPPILVQDQDLEQIVRWWSHLEHLDLGSLPTFDRRWSPRVTPGGLSVLSRGSPALKTLVIPVDITGITHESVTKYSQNPNASLHNITISALTPPDLPILMASFLNRLFPSLVEVHGTCGHEEHWADVQHVLKLLQTSSTS